MEQLISDTHAFLTLSKEIWYSKAHTTTQVYEIKIITTAINQGKKSITKYANFLQSLWQELDHYQVIKMKCSKDAAILKNYIGKDRMYDFLARLNPKFDQVRIQILGKEDIPSLEEVISLIHVEENQKSVMPDP